ncbi:hypothetical protein KAR91_14290 [Candidatus Pacearchaeota archaeon]|nr:hypothetical protein [Candidatus Pacearchaeota archaeon]
MKVDNALQAVIIRDSIAFNMAVNSNYRSKIETETMHEIFMKASLPFGLPATYKDLQDRMAFMVTLTAKSTKKGE